MILSKRTTMIWRKKQLPKRGIAAVEFAVIAPVFFLILLGTIETCTMIFLQQSLKIAAYEAARSRLGTEKHKRPT